MNSSHRGNWYMSLMWNWLLFWLDIEWNSCFSRDSIPLCIVGRMWLRGIGCSGIGKIGRYWWCCWGSKWLDRWRHIVSYRGRVLLSRGCRLEWGCWEMSLRGRWSSSCFESNRGPGRDSNKFPVLRRLIWTDWVSWCWWCKCQKWSETRHWSWGSFEMSWFWKIQRCCCVRRLRYNNCDKWKKLRDCRSN